MTVGHEERNELTGRNGSKGGLFRDYYKERVNCMNSLEVLSIGGNENRIVQSEETMTFGWMSLQVVLLLRKVEMGPTGKIWGNVTVL